MSIDLIRGVLAGLLFLIGLMLWDAWQAEHPSAATAAMQTTATQNPAAPENIAGMVSPPAVTPAAAQTKLQAMPVKVDTDVLQVKIDPVGGSLINANLPQYPISLTDKNPFVLFNEKANTFYTAQSGLSSPQGPDYKTAAIYQAAQSHYALAPNQDELVVPMVWKNDQGIEVTKTFTFHRNSYEVDVAFTVKNQGGQVWQGQFYSQLKRADVSAAEHKGMFGINPFLGAVLSSPDKRYQKFSFKDLTKEPVNTSIQNGWMAMEEHYFITAWIPDPKQTYQYSSQSSDNNLFEVNMVGAPIKVAPGQTQTIQAKLYMGPAIASTLKQIAPGLDLTVDYGFLWFIGVILFWLLDHIHHFVGNWGWSIILLTIFVKLCFFKLSAASYRSMAAMRKLQPQLQQLKERYGDDRQKMGQMTMELYKREKVNPMGGCLPILVQIPVFIALYWVLLESVQLRLAPFALWIHDLASPDPFYILPILMGATMFLQQRMSPAPPDPMQAKMMMAMPIVFTFFFLNFPAGLVLYWVVSNIISIAQQWYITKKYGEKN